MERFAGINPEFLVIHPMEGTDELALPPLSMWLHPYTRLSISNGLSIHLLGDAELNSVVMVIDPGPTGGGVWRVYVHYDLWSSGELERSLLGVEPLFCVHPLGWGSDAHKKLLASWGEENGVEISAVMGLSGHLMVSL